MQPKLLRNSGKLHPTLAVDATFSVSPRGFALSFQPLRILWEVVTVSESRQKDEAVVLLRALSSFWRQRL